MTGATHSAEVLTRDDLDRLAGRSLAELLGHALGLDAQIRSPAQADLAIRGSSFNQVVVLVNGVRVSDVQSGHYALDLAVPLAMIERIEILRGGSAALYGSDAVGGVVNIVTRDEGEMREAALRGGSFGGARAAALVARQRDGWHLAVGADADRSGGHREGTDYEVAQARLAVSRPTALGRMHVEVGEGRRRFGAAGFYAPYPSEETTRSTTAAVRLDDDAGRRVSLGAAAHARRHSDLFTLVRTKPAQYQNEHLSWETGGDAHVRASLSAAATLVLGAEVLDARLRSARLGDHAQRRIAASGELGVAASRRTVLSLALRGDHVEEAGGFLSPTIGIAAPLSATTQWRGSVSRGFRAATWTERYYRDPGNVADSSLAVERFWSSEVGVRSTAGGRTILDVALFERLASNLIDWARPTGSSPAVPWRTMNFAAARYRGVEGSLRVPDLGGIDVTVRVSGLHFTAASAAGLVGKYALRPLTRTLGVTASRAIGDGSVVTLDALRGRRASEADHTQLGARVQHRLAAPLELSLELLNLTNASFLDASGQPVAGRSVFVGAAWRGR